MDVRMVPGGTPGTASKFNVHAMFEVIVYFQDGSADSVSGNELEVKIGENWVPLTDAFKGKDVIPDNYNTSFRAPLTMAERIRGWY